ncbi:hypothetical protein FB478_11266 [Arthrobacter sp. AG367]|nr:hypothetical protein FB478_11266 [Arthrobacter sp. AG367]
MVPFGEILDGSGDFDEQRTEPVVDPGFDSVKAGVLGVLVGEAAMDGSGLKMVSIPSCRFAVTVEAVVG